MTMFEDVKKYAKLRGMNLQEVALKAGLSQNALYKWNRKEYKPSQPTIAAVAKVLHISIENLTGKSRTQNRKK